MQSYLHEVVQLVQLLK